MSNSYYYLIASLPYLSFNKPQAISISEFTSRCSSYLNKNDFEVTQSIISGDPNRAARSLKTVSEWLSLDMELRVELAGLRAADLGRSEAEDGEKGVKTLISDLVMEIFSAASPLAADEMLESARWRRLESLELGQYFNLEWVALYCLKLKIMERRRGFVMEIGMDRVANILETAKGAYAAYDDKGVSDAA